VKQKARVDAFQDIKKTALQNTDEDELELPVKMERLGSKIVEFHKVGKNFGEKKILEDFTYNVQRLERLYDLSRMVYADHILGPKQKEILTKFALALGFTPGNVPYIVDKALSLLVMNVDSDTFVYEMTHMNK
jgi:hypothetical protein